VLLPIAAGKSLSAGFYPASARSGDRLADHEIDIGQHRLERQKVAMHIAENRNLHPRSNLPRRTPNPEDSVFNQGQMNCT
jgi:hypothetical protein